MAFLINIHLDGDRHPLQRAKRTFGLQDLIMGFCDSQSRSRHIFNNRIDTTIFGVHAGTDICDGSDA